MRKPTECYVSYLFYEEKLLEPQPFVVSIEKVKKNYAFFLAIIVVVLVSSCSLFYPPVYTVSFDTKGGTKIPNQVISEGTTANIPSIPTKSGYGFGDWYSDAGCTTIWDFATVITTDMTLYAQWKLVVTRSTLITMISNGEDVTKVDTSTITDMCCMFDGASSFNQDISGWDVSSVTDMCDMFDEASAFNGDISGWDVSSVTDMDFMFCEASSFNGDISDWDVSSVTDMDGMFYNASSFNQDISGWDVSNDIYHSDFSGGTCPLLEIYHPNW